MDPILLAKVGEQIPDLNDDICEGIATKQLLSAEHHVDMVFKCAAKDFPEGLVYLGYRRLTPIEEFKQITRERDNKSNYEIARNDFYMCGYRFAFNGEELYEKHLMLPFVDRGGLLYVRGKSFAVSPVLADQAFSVSSHNMFIQLTRTRLTFERTPHHYMANGERETTYVVWSWIHQKAYINNAKRSGSGRVMYSTLANYLFIRYGVKETFLNFAAADIVVGDHTTVNNDIYPEKDWVICSSTGIVPKSYQGDKSQPYTYSNIRIAVQKKQYTSTVKYLIGGFFYIIDHHPRRFKAEEIEEPWHWKVVLGLIINGTGTQEGIMVNEIDEHIRSISEYIDNIVKDELRRAGIMCEDIYEVFMYVMDTLSKQTLARDDAISSLYDKRLITLRYVLYDVIAQINNLMFSLKNAKNNRGPLSATEINNLMNMFLRPSVIAKVSNQTHPEVMPVAPSSDNIFFGITNAIVTQDNASNAGGKKAKINLKDPTKHLHVSLAEVASYNAMSKADPTGKSRINPFLKTTSDGTVLRDTAKKNLLDHVQLKLMS